MGIKNRFFSYCFPKALAARAIRRLPASQGVVLTYHEVLPDDVAIPAWTIVRETEFRGQMRYLAEHFDVLSPDRALARVSGEGRGGRPFAVVSFDDGYRGNLDTALPIMASLGLPFTVYVATAAVVDRSLYWYDRIINLLNLPEDVPVSLATGGRVERFVIPRSGGHRRWLPVQQLLSRLKQLPPGERTQAVERITAPYRGGASALEMLSPEGLERLSRSELVTVGSHSHGHELLPQLEPREVRLSLETAHAHLLRLTGRVPRHFAYPNGDFNRCVQEEVRQAGYLTAVTVQAGRWSDRSDPLQVPRHSVGRFDTVELFRAKLSGYL